MKNTIFIVFMLALNGWTANAANATDATNKIKVLVSHIMTECDAGNNKENFSFFVSCIKNDYTHLSNDRSYDSVIKMFYSQLDVIDENYRQRSITNEKAKAVAYKTWQEMFN